MMSLAARRPRQLPGTAQERVKFVTLLLSARVLPIGTVRVGESGRELFLQRPGRIEILQ